ncbi:hypothetical protein [Streptacidiphilus jiangxiensis]|uniref:Uncharacterized protein n=1 Tax=Streptacidiphilus jiangxiensis TaxID=235985 RepID=A0A1H7PBB5_STRJI|nr:hypothetical protein [Streptacidiphilus jiangxiensis]SEL32939.1 hypothetical protein SAMN05414137_107300 [Streptacidiphilus jiangxiensis]
MTTHRDRVSLTLLAALSASCTGVFVSELHYGHGAPAIALMALTAVIAILALVPVALHTITTLALKKPRSDWY